MPATIATIQNAPTFAQADSFTPESVEVELEAERIARELKLPPCPTLLNEFYRAINNDNTDLRKLANVVSTDLALSAALLKTVNSAAYGLARNTGSIPQALSIIGLRATANMIARLLFRQAFPNAVGTAMQQFWDTSSILAETGAEVAYRVARTNIEEATTYLVFRDCGMAVMINRFPDYAPIWQAHRDGRAYEALTLEQRLYRTNHAHVGYAMAKEWRVPESLCIAILCHHEIAKPSGAPLNLRGTPVKLAAFGLLVDQVIASRAGRGVTADWEIAEPFVISQLAISADDIIEMISPDTRH